MIEVVHTGIYVSIQDLGRKGMSQFGVSRGGAMDFHSFALANSLLGNHENDACLEITFGGGKFLFQKNTCIALTGGNYSPMINNKAVKLNSVIPIAAGDLLTFGKRKNGVYTYLAVKGGLQSEMVLGSRSQFKNITPKFRLEKGDLISIVSTSTDINASGFPLKNADIFDGSRIDCYPGPEFHSLNDHQRRQLTQAFQLSKACNRIGVTLEECIPNDIPQILSSAVMPGTVQLTPSGKLIILMRDCQTTGGYPRVLQLDSASVNRLSQKFTGEKIRFSLRIEGN